MQTENAQPALLTMSIAVLELLRETGIKPDYVAGHSLGEYSALVAAEVLPFEEAVLAVHKRGLFMKEAVPPGKGAMTAVLGMERQQLENICQQVKEAGHIVEPANLNCPGQIVISGSADGVEKAASLAKEAGARRVIPLQVSGPFHSSLMKPAATRLAEILNDLHFQDAETPVVANVTASPVTDRNEIRTKLIEQVYSPVRWEETVRWLLHHNVDTFIEVGAGNVLSGMVRKVERSAKTFSVCDRASMEKMLEKLGGNQ